ncbi:DUF6252 family protein [Aquimarina addita]
MKVLIKVVCVAFVFMTMSCGSDDDSSSDSGSDSFFTKIDGVAYNPEFVNGFITTFGTNIFISGSQANGDNVVINFPISAVAGETFTVEDLQFVASFDTSDGRAFLSSEGSVTITTHNTESQRISGTFSFIANPLESNGATFTFTEGTFDVSYTDL